MMTASTTRALAELEYDFIRIDAALEEARDVLRRAAREEPRCIKAAADLRKIRRRLRDALVRLDPVISDAVQAVELLESAPF
jgi:hypothetical protein